jgi:hypothetical protein
MCDMTMYPALELFEPVLLSDQTHRPLFADDDHGLARDRIARRAYQLGEDGGRVHGHDKEHWFRAEHETPGAHSPPQSYTVLADPGADFPGKSQGAGSGFKGPPTLGIP